MEKVSKYLKWIILALCLVAFGLILKDVLINEITTYDNSVYNFINNHFIKESNHNIAKVLTFLGSTLGIIIFAIIAVIVVKGKKNKIAISLNLVSVVAINQIVKFIVSRPRPNVLRIVEETGYSFPSGHSMVSLSFYGFLVYLICKNTNNRLIKVLTILCAALIVLGIGFSRIYLGVHYASDVLAGYLGAIIELILFVTIFNKVGDNIEK